jgi:hypothetical protein
MARWNSRAGFSAEFDVQPPANVLLQGFARLPGDKNLPPESSSFVPFQAVPNLFCSDLLSEG